MEHLDNFRNEVKVWLDDNCPPSMRTGADPEIPHDEVWGCLLYTSPSPRDRQKSRMPSSA